MDNLNKTENEKQETCFITNSDFNKLVILVNELSLKVDEIITYIKTKGL